jgi:hypothetical protein
MYVCVYVCYRTYLNVSEWVQNGFRMAGDTQEDPAIVLLGPNVKKRLLFKMRIFNGNGKREMLGTPYYFLK